MCPQFKCHQGLLADTRKDQRGSLEDCFSITEDPARIDDDWQVHVGGQGNDLIISRGYNS